MVFIPGFSRPTPFPNQVPRSPLPTGSLTQFEPGGLPTNVLQQITPSDPLAVTQMADQMQAQPITSAPIPTNVMQDIKPQRERRSFLDTVGRLADVLATVGGAEALYQPTLDAREDRARMIDIEAMKRRQLEQQINEGDESVADRQRARAGVAMKGLQAIQARGGDINAAWPILAKQAGLGPEDTAFLADAFAKDPNSVSAITAMFGGETEFGLQPFYAQGPDGTLQAYQIGKDGSIQPIQLPEGTRPIDPLKFVDTGNQQVGVGSRTGQPIRILPKGVDPDTGARITSNERIAGANNQTRITVAGMRGTGSGNQNTPINQQEATDNALSSIAELRGIYGSLNNMGAMVSPKNKTGANVLARVRSSGAGQYIEGAIGTEAQTQRDRINSIRPGLMQTLAKATGMTGKQLDSNADVQLFMKTVTDPTASYEANMAALDGLERLVRSRRQSPKPQPKPRPSPKPQPKPRSSAKPQPRITPRKSSNPSISNW